MSKRLSGVLLATALAAFAALLFVQTFKVRNFPGTRFGAEIWPRAIILCLGLLAVALLIQSLRRRDAERTGPGLGELLSREGIAFAVFACFFCFLWLVPRFGAYPAGGLFVFAVLSILGPKSPRAIGLHLLISVGMTVVLWALFAHVLKVIAPVGRWWALV